MRKAASFDACGFFCFGGQNGRGVLWRKLIEAVAGGKSLIVNK
jgi:hypothetical protein